jgi:hypothetical protein
MELESLYVCVGQSVNRHQSREESKLKIISRCVNFERSHTDYNILTMAHYGHYSIAVSQNLLHKEDLHQVGTVVYNMLITGSVTWTKYGE